MNNRELGKRAVESDDPYASLSPDFRKCVQGMLEELENVAGKPGNPRPLVALLQFVANRVTEDGCDFSTTTDAIAVTKRPQPKWTLEREISRGHR